MSSQYRRYLFFSFFLISPFLAIIYAQSANDVPELIYDDRFFIPEVYPEIQWDKSRVASSLIRGLPYMDEIIEGLELDKNGYCTTFTRQEVAQIALERFKSKATELGITQGNITKAMFEGEFNPYFEDVRLAYEGLADFKDLTRGDISERTKKSLIRDRMMSADGNDMPTAYNAEVYLSTTLSRKRNIIWNTKFGSVYDLRDTPIITHINGNRVIVTGKDIALRHMMRIHGSHFESDYAGIIKIHPDLRYDAAVKKLKKAGRSDLVTAFQDDVDVFERYQAGSYSYFRISSGPRDKTFNLLNDYLFIRDNIYLPKLVNIYLAEKARQLQAIVDQVRIFLRYIDFKELPETGPWDALLETTLQQGLFNIQKSDEWGENWEGPYDGIYAEKFALYLKFMLGRYKTDPEENERAQLLEDFLDALDYLKEEGIYTEPLPITQSVSTLDNKGRSIDISTPGQETVSARAVAFLAFTNGFFWNWADDWHCMLSTDDDETKKQCIASHRYTIQQGKQNHKFIFNLLYWLGVQTSLFGVFAIIVIALIKIKEQQAFIIAFISEAIEGFIAFSGELNTFGYIDNPFYAIIFILITAVLTGTFGLFFAKKPRKTNSETTPKAVEVTN